MRVGRAATVLLAALTAGLGAWPAAAASPSPGPTPGLASSATGAASSRPMLAPAGWMYATTSVTDQGDAYPDGTGPTHLTDGPHGTTIMDWTADVQIHGKLASVGARLIEGTAKKMIDQTFDCIRVKLEA